MAPVPIEDQVGLLACFERSDFLVEVQGARPTDRRHLDHLPCGKRTRVHARNFLQFCRDVHFLKQVLVVVARGAVGRQADRHARGEHFHDGHYARGQLHIARRIVDCSDDKANQRRDIRRVHPNAMRADNVRAQHADALKIGHRRSAMLRAAQFAFERGFGQVGQDRDSITSRKSRSGLQVFRRERIDGMGRHSRSNERIIFPTVDVLLRVRQGRGRRLMIRRGEIDDRLAQHAAHAGFFCYARDYVLEVVHVGVGRNAAAQHFEHAKTRAPKDELFVTFRASAGKMYFCSQSLSE